MASIWLKQEQEGLNDMERFNPKPNDVWKSADGYEVIIVSVHQMTGERDITVNYIRKGRFDGQYQMKLEDFMDEVDTENYPESNQKYLFEFVMEDF